MLIFQNGKVIETSANTTSNSNMRQLEGTNVLLITDVTGADAGEYRCSAFNHITNQVLKLLILY